jgi:acetyl-CoA C-acetyltransferase
LREVVIVGGARTPIGDFNGSLKDLTAVELGIIALKGAMAKTGVLPSQIEEVLGGNVYQAGNKGNPARQVAMGAGCPVETVAATINQQCPSSMRAAEIISQEIMLNKIDVGAVVGMESMTNVPYLLLKARNGYRMGSDTLHDGLMWDALIDAFNDYHVGITAENLAEQYAISREEQDAFGLESQRRAVRAIKDGKFLDEIVPVEIRRKNKTVVIDTDEHPRDDLDMDFLAKLKPAFREGGTVTPGNASALNDGGAALVIMAKDKAEELGIKPLARMVSTASAAVDPKVMGIGVVPAVHRALKFASLQIDDIELWEINEAFAAQVIACNRELKLDLGKVNVNGSGISLGHPVGATGARIILHLINEMRRRSNRYGCATLCAGGGPGMAFIVEALY